MIPATLWRVFSARWVDMRHTPADAPDWLERGFLRLQPQGKLLGYAIAPRGYALIVRVPRCS